VKHLILIVSLMCAPLPALAHKVIAGVFPAGDAIEGELGFSSGDMAVGQEVIVYGPDGAELGRTMTDEDGFFLYTPTSPVAHSFTADMGAGHVAKVVMAAEEVAEVMGVAARSVDTPAVATPIKGATGVTVASLSDEER
jgi:nickel transport protein